VVEALLAKGAQVDLADKVDLANENGCTPLYMAAFNGHNEVVEALLAKGAQVDLADEDGRTPLYIAACNGRKEVVEALLAKGAQVDLAEQNEGTLLHIAACNGHKVVVEALLAKGAQVDLADKDGWTPLYGAACSGHNEVVEALLAKERTRAQEQGARWREGAGKAAGEATGTEGWGGVEEMGGEGEASRMDGHHSAAALHGLWQVAESSACRGRTGGPPITKAGESTVAGVKAGGTVEGRSELQVRHEVLKGWGRSGDGWRGWRGRMNGHHSVAAHGHNEVVEALLAKGAQVDLADEDGRTPLYIAACNGRKEVVEALLAKGAQVDLAEQNEGTLLHIAACNGHKVVVEALLAKGAQVDLADKVRPRGAKKGGVECGDRIE
ncbi:hypothetical protein CYMTET_24756, partial [Cymbomonas tetramitiformis]